MLDNKELLLEQFDEEYDSDPDYDPAQEELSDDEPDDAAAHLSQDLGDEPVPAEPIHRQATRNRRERLAGSDVVAKVLKIQECIEEQGMDLALFLDAVSWGDDECHSNRKIQYMRTSLLVSDELPNIIRRWYRPPRAKHESKGARPRGAHEILKTFAVECINEHVDREMKTTAPLFLSPPEDFSEKKILNTDLQKLQDEVEKSAPIVWGLFHRAARSPEQDKTDIRKDINSGTLSRISQCQYSRSHRRGRLQKIWAIYLKACGLSARAFDAIHALGLTMSFKWTTEALIFLGKSAMAKTRSDVLRLPWNISHDNVNLPKRVFSQRIDNQSLFVSATAGTIWVLPERARLPANINQTFQLYRATNAQKIFPYADVLYHNAPALNRIESQHKYRLLRVLLDSPEFHDYEHRDHPLLSFPPEPTNQLKCGKENSVQQHILGTCELEEASYDGTLKVMEEFFKQLGLDSQDEKMKTGIERLIVWLGDQLTVERLRGLWKYRHADHNAFDRLDYMIPMFGWFHLVMAFATSLHKQYLGTSAGVGSLRHAFDVMKRKGLVTTSIKGPFWHHLDEAIKHVSEAHFRASWLQVSGANTLQELKKISPKELVDLCNDVWMKRCSRSAIVELDMVEEEVDDHVLRNAIMWNIDVLPYLELRDAIKVGDVGRMEDLIPTLLFRFAGGGNSKYAIEMLELLQGLHCEWPDEIKQYIKEWCWVITRTGARDGFVPVDLGQEQNILDVKVNYKSMGPGATMAYVKKISPAIPTLRKIERYVESQFKTSTRRSAHTTPDKDKDVDILTTQYVESKIYSYVPTRRFKNSADKPSDYTTDGANNLERLGTIKDWWNRRTFTRATGEKWDIPMEVD